MGKEAMTLEKLGEGIEKLNKRFDEVDSRFVAIDKKFDVIDQRFDKIDERFDDVDKSLTRLEVMIEQTDDKFTAITEGQDIIREVLETKVAHIEEVLELKV